MYFGTPQIIMVVLMMLNIGVNIAKYADSEQGKVGFWSSTISTVFMIGLLYWGGFFS